MSNFVSTGVTGLDDLLHGGVLDGNSILVEGPPGCGKTTLAMQFVYEGAARCNEPGLLVTFEMTRDKLIRDALGLGMDLQRCCDDGSLEIIQTSPEILFTELHESSGVLRHEIERLGARRVAIDGMTPLKLFAMRESRPHRQDLFRVAEGLVSLGATILVTGEREGSQRSSGADERFVFDTVFRLDFQPRGRSVRRVLEVIKSRGQSFIDGEHTVRITSGVGLQVYRRAFASPSSGDRHHESQPSSDERIGSGVPGLDEILGGGLYRGSITMVAGISGTGKTVAATQVLLAGLKANRKGLLVTLDEHPAQLIRNARTLGIDLQSYRDSGQLEILYDSPLELELDVHYQRVCERIDSHRAEIVVFDSAAAYETAEPDEVTDFLYALANFVKQRLATTIINYESPELLGLSQISENLKGSHLVDNIILLNYVEISTRLRRALVAPKVRGSANRQQTHEFAIGPGGIEIFSERPWDDDGGAVPQLPFSSYYGLLSRSPARRSPVIEEEIQRQARE